MSKVLILDGGLGTSLERKYDVKFDHSRPLWSSDLLVSDTETLLACQSDFGSIPVDIILTATYQVSYAGFAATKTAEFPEGIDGASVGRFVDKALQIAQAAKAADASIALSVGPYGACMIPSQEYSGEYDAQHSSLESLQAWHQERLKLFASVPQASSRIAYVALETLPRVDEIIAIRKALSSVESLSSLPFWMSSLFPGDDSKLPDGSSIDAAVSAMLDPSIAPTVPWGIGINCTKVWKLDGLLKQFEATVSRLLEEKRITQWPALVLYPDGTNGEVYNTTTQKWEVPAEAQTGDRVPWEEQLAEVVKNTQSRGNWAQIVAGGCCMSGADDISRLRNALR
ncbi:Homocysteine S-methyltransferase [Paramyrothecium foliicola]|nr:Homocysteine S-methyltransferase [Paramyrothecium foliicola]